MVLCLLPTTPLGKNLRNLSSKIRNLISNLTNAEYDKVGEGLVLRIVQLATGLNELNVPVPNDFLLHNVLFTY